MKKAIFVTGALFVLLACNQSGEQTAGNNNSDTASHSAHNGDTTGTAGASGSGAMSGGSMMELMEKNMDEMKGLRSLGSNDKDFASMMKIHHTGAVEMARLQIAQGTDQQVKQLAQRMIDEQQREISEFDAVLAGSNQNSAATDKSSPFYDRVMKEMDNLKMDSLHDSGSVDQQFVQMMIPHHQGAIAMADLYLKTGAKDEKLKAMATRIKTDQQKEIQQLQAMAANRK